MSGGNQQSIIPGRFLNRLLPLKSRSRVGPSHKSLFLSTDALWGFLII